MSKMGASPHRVLWNFGFVGGKSVHAIQVEPKKSSLPVETSGYKTCELLSFLNSKEEKRGIQFCGPCQRQIYHYSAI
jgi:hypothetical protein